MNDILNQKEFARKLSERSDLTYKKSIKIVSCVINLLLDELQADKTIKFKNFGTFKMVNAPARYCKSNLPTSSEPIFTHPKKRIKLKVSRTLTNRL